jgi:hypothetical protein
MNLTLTGGTQQQRDGFSRAISRCTYPFDTLTADVNVSWPPEPTCPGHKEFACTHNDGAVWQIEIRNTLDSDQPMAFYEETCIHEAMHVVTFVKALPTSITAWFYKDSGSGRVNGEAADWNPLDSDWGDRIQETVAEVLKDVFLADQYRYADNRTNWLLDQDHFTDLMNLVIPTATGGEEKTIAWLDSFAS